MTRGLQELLDGNGMPRAQHWLMFAAACGVLGSLRMAGPSDGWIAILKRSGAPSSRDWANARSTC